MYMGRPKKGDRVPISATMKRDLKEQLERIAQVRGLTFSGLLEQLGEREIESIDPDKLVQLEELIASLNQSEAPPSQKNGRAEPQAMREAA